MEVIRRKRRRGKKETKKEIKEMNQNTIIQTLTQTPLLIVLLR
jgi:hypothetical protein